MDKIQIEILEDGTIKVSTDRVSMPNHVNAEGFLRQMFALTGGEITRRAKHAASHVFGQSHSHSHDQNDTQKQ